MPGWIARAADRTNEFRLAGEYNETSAIWSEIKPVLMKLQGRNKCCFCERKLESGNLGRHELDVEHFRPKRKVRKTPKSQIGKDIATTSPPEGNKGYYLLSYHLLNYAVACKPCNSGLKKNCFPIAGAYNTEGDDPRDLTTEEPWLLYPIGSIDIDPEHVVSFHGIFPQSRHADEAVKQRGSATIAFFGLDDVDKRKDLLLERGKLIILLHSQLSKAADQNDRTASEISAVLCTSSSPHANCARSFERLFFENRAEADEVADLATNFVLSKSD